MAASAAQTAGLFAVVLWLSWRQRRLHWAAIIAIAALFLSIADPVANWATFAVLNPEIPHFPLSWPYFRLAPLIEPVSSFLGGYSSYYVLIGLGSGWSASRLLLRRVKPSSWAGRHPLAALYAVAFLVSLPIHLLFQILWLKSGVLVYSQFAAPIWHVSGVRMPLLVALHDPPLFAMIAMLAHTNGRGQSTALCALAQRLPGRGESRNTSGRQVVIAAALLLATALVPVTAFSALRISGLARPAYGEWPYPEAKVYDPYGDLERAGKPGPYYR